jgi:SAM-dependent methyltransferase
VRLARRSLGALWRGIGAQLRNPSGLSGRIAGGLMGFANAKSNAAALAALNLRHGESVIELGCGPGHALRAMLQNLKLKQAIGVDWSPVMLAQAARRNQDALEAGRLELVEADLESLPFDDACVDAMLAVNVVYFMTAASVAEARRVLRPGGRLVLYATHGSIMRRWPFAGHHSHRLFDRKRLAALVAEAGFAQDRIRIDDVDAGFSVKGLLAVAAKEDTPACVIRNAAPKRATRSAPTASRAAVARSRATREMPAE